MRNPSQRLGSKGIDELKDHPWLSDIQWEKLLNKKAKSPFKPMVLKLLPRALNKTMITIKNKSLRTQSTTAMNRCTYSSEGTRPRTCSKAITMKEARQIGSLPFQQGPPRKDSPCDD